MNPNPKVLVVVPYSAGDAVMCERNLDHIFRLNGLTAIGTVLLVPNADVHAEMRAKVAVTAKLAFANVIEAPAPKVEDQFASSKFRQMNNLFLHAALTAQQRTRWPWLWLEPDCVPVVPDWLNKLAFEYDSKPTKYLGLIAKAADGGQFMARCGIYYIGASFEFSRLTVTDVPFPIATSSEVIPRALNTDLIQYLQIASVEDLEKISDSAVLVHGDKMGIFAENSIYEASPAKVEIKVEPPRLSRRQIREAAMGKKPE